jgi:hypothetical protein
MYYKNIAAAEIEQRTNKLINALWNSKKPKIRFAMHRAFYGVKPNTIDFLVNASLMIQQNKKDPEA